MAMLRFGVTIVLASLLLVLAGCAVSPETKPVVIHKPVDAFDAIDQPHAHRGDQYRGGLSSDVEHLQDAHRLYELSQDRQRAQAKRRQGECRDQEGSRRVPIKGVGGTFVYCQPTYDSQPRQPKSDK